MLNPVQRLSRIAVGVVALALAGAAWAQTVIPLPLSTGVAGKISLGFFPGGSVQITVTGTGDVVSSNYQTNPDGSLAAVAAGSYTFANPGANYGVGVNQFPGGGANFDFSSTGYGFAGFETQDSTDPAVIRFGAVVGTFVANPTRSDWFLIGSSALFAIPGGGATVFVAVNDTNSADNHGSYSLTYAAVPEPSLAALALGLPAAGVAAWRRGRQRGWSRWNGR